MKIISWNECTDETEKKYSHIKEYTPDILILLEISNKRYQTICNEWKYSCYYNDDLFEKSQRGIAIFSNEFDLGFTDNFNRNLRYVIPFSVSKNKQFLFYLFVVWTKTTPVKYYKNVLEALKFSGYHGYIQDKSLFIGDFNTLVKKDKTEEYNNLLNTGLIDCSDPNDILKPTYSDKIYDSYFTADLCLATKKMKDTYRIKLSVPDFDNSIIDKKTKYFGLSDHSPLIVEIEE